MTATTSIGREDFTRDGRDGTEGLQRDALAAANSPMIRTAGLRRTYRRGAEAIRVLDGIDLHVERGRFEALMGPSGSGKTTLLNLIAGLDRPTEGSLEVDGHDIVRLNDRQLAAWRARTVGFVFQSFNLIPVLTAAENVELPLLLAPLGAAERKRRAQTALRLVDLEERASHYPRQLSGGQEQRVAIARALVSDPALIVADEPTGDLDRKSADDVLALLSRLSSEFHKTIIMVTHDPIAAERAHVVRRMDKGVLR
jgi:putative ABC transport system ATP-binding protein